MADPGPAVLDGSDDGASGLPEYPTTRAYDWRPEVIEMTDRDGDLASLRALVEAQQTTIERLGDALTRLEARLVQFEDGRHLAPSIDPTSHPAVPQLVDSVLDEPVPGVVAAGLPTTTDRRALFSRAAAAAAGAAVGAVAFGGGAPVAAASGTFDGNPALTVTGTGTNATGVTVTTTGLGPAVSAQSVAGPGVRALSGSGTAVFAQSGGTGFAVDGSASAGVGVRGRSSSGVGVWGEAPTAVIALGSTVGVASQVGPAGTHLRLDGPSSLVPPPGSTVQRFAGSMVRDNAGDLWYSIASGTPGTWRRITGPNTAGALTLLAAPVRVYDSRPGQLPNVGVKAPLAGNTTRNVDVTANSSGVPLGATGVLANVTVANTSAAGFVTGYRTGEPRPNASTLNWFQPGSVVANTTVIGCDASGRLTLFASATGTTDVLIDVIGYFR